MLFYLNEPAGGGGETLFLTPQRRAVKPKKGAVILFPASPTHVHAGAPPGAWQEVGASTYGQPRAGSKYVVSNFASSCDLSDLIGIPRPPPLGESALELVATHFSSSPAEWGRPKEPGWDRAWVF